MKLITLFISLCLSVIACSAQNEVNRDFLVKIDTTSYIAGTEKVVSLTYELYNRGNDNILIWLTKDNVMGKSDSLIIKDFFFRKPRNCDFSLYQIAMDWNVEVFIPVLFDTFLKRIMPRDHFTIQIINTESISERTKKTVFDYINHHIVVVKENNVLKTIPSLKEMSQVIFFKQDVVTIKLEKLYCKYRP